MPSLSVPLLLLSWAAMACGKPPDFQGAFENFALWEGHQQDILKTGQLTCSRKKCNATCSGNTPMGISNAVFDYLIQGEAAAFLLVDF